MIAMIIHTLIITLYNVFHLVSTECPQNAENRIQLCIKSSLPNFGFGTKDPNPPHAIKASIEMSKDSCQSKKLESSVICMQKFLDLCKGTTDREQLLHMLFDKKKIKDTVQYFCASLPVYERHAQCISQQHQLVLNCSKDEATRYKTIYTGKPTNDVLIQANCRFNKVATECLIDFAFLNCGLEAASFLETLALGQTPPICDQRTRRYVSKDPGNSALSFQYSVWITLLLYLCHVIIQ